MYIIFYSVVFLTITVSPFALKRVKTADMRYFENAKTKESLQRKRASERGFLLLKFAGAEKGARFSSPF